ncbi:PAS domain S-box protein [Leptolyngbya sp. FACHB-321]|uniref:hybrid sensor histidine kinase/response regulator n=1 Tax=Leptolyngbya sp. FACHB-321 TaxID=2692807 RepID=UPI0016832444|nr:PAS domain S-box protein [Leptolyngbya sp. FACHB-321]MBD2037712.1 PAS domain S-box protein [Leptolyngbya sp. FACHB-321]
MPKLTRSQLSHYSFAGLSVLLATLLMLLLDPVLAMTQSPFLLFFGAVMVSAWSGGFGPGLFATALAGLISTYYFLPPLYSLSLNWVSGSRLSLFLLEGVLISVLADALRVAKQRLERTLSKLRSSEAEYRQLALQSQEQAKTLKAIFAASVDHIYVFDQAGRYGYVSDGGAQVLGFSPDALLGKTWRDIGLPAALMEPVDAQREKVMATGRSLKSETDFLTDEGVRSYEYILTPLSTDPSTQAVVVISRDITERKQAEVARHQALLREQAARAEAEVQRNRLYSILVQAPASICIDRGPDHLFEFANPLFCQLVGNRALIGRTVREAFPEVAGQGFFERLDQVFATGEPFVGNEVAARLDRQGNGTLEEGFFNFVYQPLFDLNGAVEGIITFGFEVTTQVVARRQAEALAADLRTQQLALQKSEARFSRLVEANLIGVLLAGPNGTILEANDAFLKMVGYTREDLHKGVLNWSEMTPPEYVQQDQQVLQALAITGSCTPFEKEYFRKDGSRLPILLGAARLENDALAWVCFVLDLTESKQTEALLRQQAEALARANRLKDEFLATVSHELRTPLNAMLGWATLLRGKQLDEATQQRALETIERNARAQNQLIDDLLDVSRIITGKLRLDVRPVVLVSVLEAALDSIRPAAEAKSLRLQSLLDPAAGPISGDPDRLQQVFWNLLSNAVKFTPKGGRIQLRLERINSHVEITVSDTGQGISPEFLPYVFERLQQADSTTTRTHGGLGLGLAIVRHLVELHGGHVQVASAGEGQGTTFMVTLPITIFRPEPTAHARVHPTVSDTVPVLDAPSLAGLKVLIVDDEADARALLATLLRQSGAAVTVVTSAREALATLTQSTLEQRPDLLVSDIGMPEEDGYMLMRQVRALTPAQGGKMPAIALTAYARTEDRIKALAAGFQAHVPKPVEPAEFIAVVVNLSERL